MMLGGYRRNETGARAVIKAVMEAIEGEISQQT